MTVFTSFLEPEPMLQIAAPAFFYLSETWRNFVEKNNGRWRSFCKLLPYNFKFLILLVKSKKAIFKGSYKTILSRSRNSDLRLHGGEGGAEGNKSTLQHKSSQRIPI